MIYFLIYTFISYGIAIIVTKEDIFYELRDWVFKKSQILYSLITCPTCFSVWVGFLLATVLIITGNKTPIDLILETPIPINIFLTGCLTAGTTITINGIIK